MLTGMTLVACTSMAPPQVLPGEEPPSIDYDRRDSHPASALNYLQLKEDELRNDRDTLDRLRMSRDTDHFHGLVKARNVFSRYPVVGDSPRQRAEVIEALNATAAQYLSSVGMTAAMLDALGDAGFDVVGSVGKIVGGGAEFRDLMAVSEHAVLGTAGATTGNSFSIHVAEGPSGLQGRSITLAGGLQGGAGEGQECIFFLSDSLQRFRTSGSDNPADPEGFAQQFQPFCRSQNGELFTSASAYIPGSVGEMEIRRLMAAKKRASAKQ